MSVDVLATRDGENHVVLLRNISFTLVLKIFVPQSHSVLKWNCCSHGGRDGGRISRTLDLTVAGVRVIRMSVVFRILTWATGFGIIYNLPSAAPDMNSVHHITTSWMVRACRSRDRLRGSTPRNYRIKVQRFDVNPFFLRSLADICVETRYCYIRNIIFFPHLFQFIVH